MQRAFLFLNFLELTKLIDPSRRNGYGVVQMLLKWLSWLKRTSVRFKTENFCRTILTLMLQR